MLFHTIWIFFILSVYYHEMFSALYILNFHYEQEFKKLGCGLENATSLPNDVISLSVLQQRIMIHRGRLIPEQPLC